MFFWVALVVSITGQLEFSPEDAIFYHQQCVSADERKKLRSNSKLFECHLRLHRESTSSNVSFPKATLLGKNLDETLVPQSYTQASRFRIIFMGGQIEGRGHQKGTIDISERMERDTILREDGKIGIGRIVEKGGGEQPASGGDERGRRTEGPLRRDESILKNAAGGARDIHGRICVNINVIQIGGAAIEKLIPERGKMEVRICKEQESDLELRILRCRKMEVLVGVIGIGRRGGLCSGVTKEGKIVELVVEGNGDRVSRRKDVRGEEEEEDRKRQKKREGENKRG
ncbi:hypothetical protein QN277_008319 [Acacia crassicarpa]|uniref:Uncharacterized protein n=1 Tax=Acacia crassicarpa TaxID=499986 RepID=A0AAE1JLI6_9FABA|nr:hypothetical protein QN277_008319 [Acacia crassicarpa]